MKKTVGIIQSCHIPWRGYFDFIQQCDLFILFDCTQYTTRDWRNRNQIRTPTGLRWLSVPVHFSRNCPTLIQDTPINHDVEWRAEHRKWIELAYKNTPFYDRYAGDFFEILDRQHDTISQLNLDTTTWIMSHLGIKTPLVLSSQFDAQSTKTDRLLDLLTKVNATRYISGPTAKGYLEEEKFAASGIELFYKTYDYTPYPQPFSSFEGAVTTLDLLFNCGPAAKDHIRSQTPLEPATLSSTV